MTIEELQKHIKEYYEYYGDRSKLTAQTEWFDIQIICSRYTVDIIVHNRVYNCFSEENEIVNTFTGKNLDEVIDEVRFAYETPKEEAEHLQLWIDGMSYSTSKKILSKEDILNIRFNRDNNLSVSSKGFVSPLDLNTYIKYEDKEGMTGGIIWDTETIEPSNNMILYIILSEIEEVEEIVK